MKRGNRTTFGQILSFFSIPITIIIICFIMLQLINFSSNNKNAELSCKSSLILYSKNYQKEMLDIIHYCSNLEQNQEFMNALNNKSDINSVPVQKDLIRVLSLTRDTYPLINNMAILSKGDDLVISCDSAYSIDNYFQSIYKYDNYTPGFWRNYTLYNHTPYKSLLPSTATNLGKEYFVIPIVLHSFSTKNFDNYLIINISIDTMLQDSPAYHPTLNSHYYLLNNYTGQVYGETDALVLDNISGSDLYDKIVSGDDGKILIGRKKYFLTAHSVSTSLDGYTHFCLVPFNDIYGANMRSTAIYCVVLFMLLIILTFLILSYTRRFVSPIEKIAQQFNPHLSSRHENLFNEIELGITKIMEENNNVYTTLPLVQEMYLINYLNSNKTKLSEETIALIETSLPFSKSAFIVLIIQIYPGKAWFEEFHNSDSTGLVSDLLNTLKGLLSEKFDTFAISMASNSFCTIINVDSDFDKNSLSAYMDEIYQILKYDSTYFDMYVGIGEMHEGLIGLKQSYIEANESINPAILNESHTTDTIVALSTKDENQLYSLIIRLHIDDSEKKIADICSNITNPTELKLMYSQILTVITKAMRNKNLFTIDDFDAYSDVISKSADDIYRLIKKMLARLKLYKTEATSDDLSDDIVEYINMHFKTPLLSLNYLSEVFGISAKNISHLIKDKLGIGFSDYLTNLRIEYTKARLSETNDNIDIIYSEAGFTSKQTFFRQFKKSEGKTPSEFRIDSRRN